MIGIFLLLVSCSVAWFVVVLLGSMSRKRILMTLACLVPALFLFFPSAWVWATGGQEEAVFGIAASVVVFGLSVAINLGILLIWWTVRRLRARSS